MDVKKRLWPGLLGLILAVAACSQPANPLPTKAPAAELPTATPTSLPPTTDLTTLVDTPAPTLTPTTRPPTATPTPVTPVVGITAPDDGADILLGSDIIVRGLAQRAEAQSVWLALVSWNGRLLAEAQAVSQPQNWEAGFTVPPSVSGAAFLQATIRKEDGSVLAEDRTPVNLVIDADAEERFLALYHPLREETAVGGFNLFFDGLIFRAVNNVITISIWVDDCQTRVTRQSFVLGRSTQPVYWQGFAIVPQEISGPACAIAYTGEPGSEDWREAIAPIHIVAEDDSAAKGVRIGNPPAESHITAGQELLLYGTALNVSEAPVSVSILMENGRIISQSSAPADYWGYWEFRITLPPDVFGPAKVTVAAGDPGSDNFAETEMLIHVDPAPTPEA